MEEAMARVSPATALIPPKRFAGGLRRRTSGSPPYGGYAMLE